MSTRRTDEAGTAQTSSAPRRLRAAETTGVPDARLESLEARIKDLEEQLEEFETAFFSLGIALVHGYFVKVWEDPSGEWIADCPAMKCVTQEATRDEALAVMSEEIPEVIEALRDLGHPVAPRDVSVD